MNSTSISASRLLTAIVLLASLSTHPASAQTVLPGTQPGDLQNWPLLPPSDCKTCHGGYVAGLDYEPFDTWAGTMMANSARDPLFWAAVDIANQDIPGAGEFCIRCHSPLAWRGGRSSAGGGLPPAAKHRGRALWRVSGRRGVAPPRPPATRAGG